VLTEYSLWPTGVSPCVVGWGIVRIFAYPRYSISKRSGYLLHQLFTGVRGR
jgi:hypothetical protein